MEKYTQTMRKKYTTFISERIVALRSVIKIFPESYDFAAKKRSGQENMRMLLT
jgi:hypothetical protein